MYPESISLRHKGKYRNAERIHKYQAYINIKVDFKENYITSDKLVS